MKLIQTDTLFVSDPCTEKVIRQASLENDRMYLKQLARAQLYDLRVRRKSVHRFLPYCFFALRCPLPKLVHLHYLLDSDGTTFKTTEAFERFYERCKEHFQALTTRSPQRS